MQSRWFGGGLRRFLEGSLDWNAHTIKVALLGSTYSPALGTQTFLSNIQSHQIVEPGYAAGGLILAGKSIAYDGALLQVTLHADDVVWDDVSFNVAWAAVYRDTGAGSTSPLVALIGDGSSTVSNQAEFRLSWPSGVLRATVVE